MISNVKFCNCKIKKGELCYIKKYCFCGDFYLKKNKSDRYFELELGGQSSYRKEGLLEKAWLGKSI